jgi:asparagine synthase (glutamine-hydrolysing)
MCGIVGSIGLTPERASHIRLAHAAIKRRGPDDSGFWVSDDRQVWLAHARLSIVDTSSAGHQPMTSADGRFVMVYNGEIYNFRELRDELEAVGETFVGHSDSEVLVKLFAREGPDCFIRLKGIFAAAFWDRARETLCLVRDPLGVKPLYFAQLANSLVFASEIKALIRSGWVLPRLDPRAVMFHLGYLWSPGTTTIVSGVHKLAPGHALEFRQGSVVRNWQYRDLAMQVNPSLGDARVAAPMVAEAVETAVKRQMVSDVPLGSFLSGGLDSSAVAAFARRELGSGSRLQCFSIEVADDSTTAEGFAEDLPYARKVAKHLDVDLHVVRVGGDMMERLQEMVYLLDEPTPDPAALNTLHIAELARSHGIKVLLSGAGGDDIFTGYRRHYALAQEGWWSWWPAMLRQAVASTSNKIPAGNPLGRRIGKAFRYASLDPDRRLASYFLWLDPQRVLALLAPEFRASLTAEDLFRPLLETLGTAPSGMAQLNRMLYLEAKHFLADHNLNYTDKMGMAAGVEVRVPLLDMDLVDLAGSLPVNLKQRGSIGKWIFKKAMEPYLPREVIYRPKTGFGVPLRRWLRGPLRSLVDEVLSPKALDNRGIFDAAAVRRLLDDDEAGKIDASYSIFGLLCLELWCRQYIDGRYAVDLALAPTEL